VTEEAEAETPEPTAEATETETPEPTEAPTEVVTPPQGPSVAGGETPDQVVASGAFRYTVESVQRADEIQGLGLPNVGYGDWVVVVVNAQNWSEDAAAFEMESFTLQTTGPSAQQVPLDSGTEQVAQTLGLMPAYSANASALFAGGEAHRVALVFLVTPDTEGIALQVGDQQVDLERALQEAVDPATLGDAPETGRLFEGQVTGVIDGETFTVDVDGVAYTVRINGIDAPAGDSCFAPEAAARASELLEGQTVLIERERTNLDDNNYLLRDVWIVNGDGAPSFVATALVADGAAAAAPDDSNTRYAGWIASADAAAQANDAGMWGACGS
jgi:endonuclease YncB( thermonuclease family)